MNAAKGLRNILRESDAASLTGQFLSKPSIFTEDSAPANFSIGEHGPYILIGAPTAGVGMDTTTTIGGSVVHRVRIYGNTDKEVDELANVTQTYLHESNPVVPGFAVLGVIAQPYTLAPTENPSVKGRLITLRLIYERA